jgi:hypothetical protein
MRERGPPTGGPTADRPTIAGSDDRALSDVVGYILVFSLVVSVVGVVSVTGFSSLENARYTEQTNNAERAFDVLADNVGDVYASGAPSRGTEISLTEASLRTTGAVTVNVTAKNTSTGDNFTLEKTSQPVVWRGTRDTEVAYSLGATLRAQSEGGVVIEGTPSRYDTDRAVVHVVQTRAPSTQFGGTTVRVRAVRASSNVLLNEPTDKYDALWLNITTPRAAIWQQHLERYPDTTCSVGVVPGEQTETVSCKFADRDAVHLTLTRIDVEIEN